jgi:hypothetical protein
MIAEVTAFSSTQTGLVLTGALVALAIVIWDWRAALLVLFLVQASIGAATVHLAQVPFQWVLIQSAVMGLSCLILGMSAAQVMKSSPSSRQAGSLWLRVMAVAMLYGGWRLLDVNVTLPDTDANVAQLYGWLAVSSFLILGLGASPLFSGVAILLWVVIVQAFVASVLEIPSLVALIGILELLVALACSYLLVAEWRPVPGERPILTDVAFPSQSTVAESGFGLGAVTGSISATVSRRWAQSRGAVMKSATERTPQASTSRESDAVTIAAETREKQPAVDDTQKDGA